MDGDCNSGRVRVFARLRPVTDGSSCGVQLGDDARSLQVLLKNDAVERSAPGDTVSAEAREFVFDGAFPTQATQRDVFAEVGLPVLQECLRGCNGTIFAYGQTGSGKTHSLLHPGRQGIDDAGLLPRLVSSLFDHIAQDTKSVYKVEVAAMQVYNEQIDDLLHPHHESGGGHNLAVHSGGVVPGIAWIRCQKPHQLQCALDRARSNLIYAETKMNKASSRSHAVFQVKLTKLGQAENGMVECTCARLSIVDLAGSERVKKSGVEGVQFREATAINKSLLALGNVVSAMAAKRTHVPFRDSKLTRILGGLIGGDCKTMLLVCVNPVVEHTQETWSSLEFASRAMHIEVHARVNCIIEVNAKALFTELSAERDAEKWRLAAEARAQETTRAQEEVASAQETAAQAITRAERAEAKLIVAEQNAASWHENAKLVEANYQAVQQEVRRLEAELSQCTEKLRLCTAELAASKAAIVTASEHANALQAEDTWAAKQRVCSNSAYATAFEAQRAEFEMRFCTNGESLEAPLADLASEVKVLREKLQNRNTSCPTTPAQPSKTSRCSEKQPGLDRREVRSCTAPRCATTDQTPRSSSRCGNTNRTPLSTHNAVLDRAPLSARRHNTIDQHCSTVDRTQQGHRFSFSAEPRKSLQAVSAAFRDSGCHTPRSRTPTLNHRR